jgi:hypothetical protein
MYYGLKFKIYLWDGHHSFMHCVNRINVLWIVLYFVSHIFVSVQVFSNGLAVFSLKWAGVPLWSNIHGNFSYIGYAQCTIIILGWKHAIEAHSNF